MPKRTRIESPQKQAMREMMKDYLKNNDVLVKDGTDVNAVMRDMMSQHIQKHVTIKGKYF